jgi:hypothetical protein
MSAVKRAEFVSDRMPYIILRGRWCNIIVMNVHDPTEDKTDDVEDRFYEELEHVFDKFLKYHTKGDFNANIGREDIFKPNIGNESLHATSNDNGVRVVDFATSKNLTVKSTMFPHLNIHKFTRTSPYGKTQNHIDNTLINTRRHLSIHDVRPFRAADFDTDRYLLVAVVWERLTVSKQTMHRVHVEKWDLKKLSEVEGKEQSRVEISNKFAALEIFHHTSPNALA